MVLQHCGRSRSEVIHEFSSQAELLLKVAPRYQEAPERQKGAILNEFVAATGYTRKYAIRLLNHPGSLHLEIARPRPRRYGRDVQKALNLACIRHPSAILPPSPVRSPMCMLQ